MRKDHTMMPFPLSRPSLSKFVIICLTAVSLPTNVSGIAPSFPINDSVQEDNVVAFLDDLENSIEKLSPKPNNFATMIKGLAKVNPTLGNHLSLNSAINSYNRARGMARNEAAMLALPLTPYLQRVDDIVNGASSPQIALLSLEKHKQALIRNPPGGLSQDEFNALILEINLSKWETGVLSSGALRSRVLADVPLWVKDILKAIGIGVGEFVSDKCLKFLIKLALAVISCAFGSVFSCILIGWYLFKVYKKCNNSVVNDPCLASPNPCCGVNCIQGYTCNSTGKCVKDPNQIPCGGGCPPWEQCLNNRCVPH